jgi:hypothetical protein
MPKPRDVREDGYIWYNNKWNNPQAFEKLQAQRKKYRSSKEGKEKHAARQREYYNKHFKGNELKQKEHYAKHKNKEWFQLKVKRENQKTWQRRKYDVDRRRQCVERNKQRYRDETPTFGLRNAVSQFRSGEIGID